MNQQNAKEYKNKKKYETAKKKIKTEGVGVGRIRETSVKK